MHERFIAGETLAETITYGPVADGSHTTVGDGVEITIGVTRARAVLNWWASAGPSFMRLAAGVAMAIGGFLVYVFRPPALAK